MDILLIYIKSDIYKFLSGSMILDNIDPIHKAYIENGRSPKKTYEALNAGTISDIGDHIEFKTFNSRIKPIMETYEFLQSDKPKSDESEIENLKSQLETMRQARQETLSELYRVQKENDKLKSDIHRYIEKDIQRDKQLKTLQGELDNQMQIEDIQDIQKEDIQMDVIRNLIEDVENLKREVANLKTEKPMSDIQDIQKDISRDIQAKKESLKLGKWSIVLQNGYYKAVRNFGVKEDGKKDIQNIYI